jgi:glycosyl transferase family 2
MLSVVVTSYNSPEVLRECLASLTRQPEAAEIVVIDCSDRDPVPELSRVFPNVRFEHYGDRRTVPEMRWAGVRLTAGELIAVIEARSVPASDWCGQLQRAIERHPKIPVAGGPVAFGSEDRAFDWGLYFCEYGAFAPPVKEVFARELSLANLCYRRKDLEEQSDYLDRGAWDTPLHENWLREGRWLLLCPASIGFRNTMNRRTAIAQRFWYGRRYAADRIERRGLPVRLLFAAFTVLLPGLMAGRIGRTALRKSLVVPYLRSLGWILLLSAAWSAGECAGYVLGHDAKARIY